MRGGRKKKTDKRERKPVKTASKGAAKLGGAIRFTRGRSLGEPEPGERERETPPK